MIKMNKNWEKTKKKQRKTFIFLGFYVKIIVDSGFSLKIHTTRDDIDGISVLKRLFAWRFEREIIHILRKISSFLIKFAAN